MNYERITGEILLKDGVSLIRMNCLETKVGNFGSIDWDTYQIMEDHGSLAIFGAFHNYELVGYAIFILSSDLKNQEVMAATNDAIYMSSHVRGYAMNFLDFIANSLASEGMNIIQYSLPAGHGFARSLRRDGFRHVETVYRKELEWPQ